MMSCHVNKGQHGVLMRFYVTHVQTSHLNRHENERAEAVNCQAKEEQFDPHQNDVERDLVTVQG